jgi:hypothetical protein
MVKAGFTYTISVGIQPTNPLQTCTVENGSGTVGSSSVTTAAVSCTNVTTYAVGGMVWGLLGSGLILVDGNNSASLMPVFANGPFVLEQEPSAFAYNVGIHAQPANPTQDCYIFNANGSVASADVTNITVACASPLGNASIQGIYKVVAYDGTGQIDRVWTLNFDGSGNVSGSGMQNNAGTVTSGTVAGTYSTDPLGLSSQSSFLVDTGLTVNLTGQPWLSGNLSTDRNTLVLSELLASGEQPGIAIGIRQGQSTFTNQSLAGTYTVASLGASAAVGSVATLSFDGAGTFSGQTVLNNAGSITNSAVSGTYSVGADGTLTVTYAGASPLTGGISADGNTVVLAQGTSGHAAAIAAGIRQGSSSFTNANINGTYAVASYGGAGAAGALWTLAFDGSGDISGSITANSGGVLSSTNLTGTYSAGANGALTVDPTGGALLTGGAGANGPEWVAGQTSAGQPASIQFAVPVSTAPASFLPGSAQISCNSGATICSADSTTFTLTNTGTAALTVFGLSSDWFGGDPFRPGPSNCPTNLAPGQSCTVQANITRSFSYKPGKYTTKLVALVAPATAPQAVTQLQVDFIVTIT